MTQKYMYLVDYFVDFPASEYGGLICVVAETADECYNIIVNYDKDMWSQYYPKLRQNVLKAQTFALAEDIESQIVENFVT